MNKFVLLAGIIIAFSCSEKKEITQIVEVSCGQCNFDIDSPKGCDLAVRIDGTVYFVDGFDIDDFGDAHDEKKGFCEVIRKGEVRGKIIHDRFEMAFLEFRVLDSVVAH